MGRWRRPALMNSQEAVRFMNDYSLGRFGQWRFQ